MSWSALVRFQMVVLIEVVALIFPFSIPYVCCHQLPAFPAFSCFLLLFFSSLKAFALTAITLAPKHPEIVIVFLLPSLHNPFSSERYDESTKLLENTQLFRVLKTRSSYSTLSYLSAV